MNVDPAESARFPRPLVAGEFAWCCDIWLVTAGLISEKIVDEMALTSAIEPVANSLLLDFTIIDGRGFLVHRAGWPFDSATVDECPIGRAPADLRPVGAGDEIFRQLIDTVEANLPGVTLHIHHGITG